MTESNELMEARRHLTEAERAFPSDATEQHLDEGLYALETIADDDGAEASVATNIGRVYVERFSTCCTEAHTLH